MSSWDKAKSLLEDRAMGSQTYGGPKATVPDESAVNGGLAIHLQPQDWYFVVDMLGSMASREPASSKRNYQIINDIWNQIRAYRK